MRCVAFARVTGQVWSGRLVLTVCRAMNLRAGRGAHCPLPGSLGPVLCSHWPLHKQDKHRCLYATVACGHLEGSLSTRPP